MGALSFDDLIPPSTNAAPAAAQAGVNFDDLIPAAQAPAPDLIPAGGGQPGLSSDPLAGLPTSLQNFVTGKPDTVAQPKPQPGPGAILPYSIDANGNASFDSKAGILGSLLSAASLPGDVATGHADPMSPEAIGRSAALASAISPVNPAVRAGDYAVPGMLNAISPGKTAAPSAEALQAAASAGYDAANKMGVEYSSPHVAALASGVQDTLNNQGILANLAPKTHAILNSLQAVPETDSSVPLSSLDAARKAFGFAAKDVANPTEQMAAKSAQSAIDQFVTRADPATVVAGPADEAAATITEARANYAAGARSNTINGVQDAADLRAAAANSGANSGNALRSRVASLILNPKASAGFNPDEIAALQGVTEGTPTSNAARTLGNLLGGGGGMHGAMTGVTGATMGYEAGGVPGAILGAGAPIVGVGAKALDNSLTAGRLSAADTMVRQRSPLFDALSADTPPVVQEQSKTAALAKAIMASGAAPSPPAVWTPGPAWNPQNPFAGGSI
jgi:hypothetical protein